MLRVGQPDGGAEAVTEHLLSPRDRLGHRRLMPPMASDEPVVVSTLIPSDLLAARRDVGVVPPDTTPEEIPANRGQGLHS